MFCSGLAIVNEPQRTLQASRASNRWEFLSTDVAGLLNSATASVAGPRKANAVNRYAWLVVVPTAYLVARNLGLVPGNMPAANRLALGSSSFFLEK